MSAAPDLEKELRTLAADLCETEWQTSAIWELEEALVDFEESGDEETLLGFLEERRNVLERAQHAYSQTPVLSEEVTAETVVGHRLLAEGIQGWLSAVDCLTSGEWDRGLREAENGNRLLVAVQRLHRRVQAQQLPRARATSP